MADRILDHLFDARRSYTIDDFSKFYRTNLNIHGQPTDDTVQECAVLSRLLYDLSSAYLMTGAERYLLAARAAADYLREAFRSLSHDGRVLLLGIRSQTQHAGRTGRIPAVRLAGTGRRQGHDPALRADLRARRPHPVLSHHPGLGGAGGHSAHHQHLPGFFLGSAGPRRDGKGFCWTRRLLLTPGSGDNAARHGHGGGEPVEKELEFGGRSHPGLSGQPHSFARAAAAGRGPADASRRCSRSAMASSRRPPR